MKNTIELPCLYISSLILANLQIKWVWDAGLKLLLRSFYEG
jgi:hypothetical protein